jgi:membrane-associated phospholipid phosphatase
VYDGPVLRVSSWLVALGTLFVLSGAARAWAEPRCDRAAPFHRLDGTARAYVQPLPLSLTLASAAPPLGLVPSGADHRLRVLAQRHLGGHYALEPVSVVAPYVVAGAVLTITSAALAIGDCSVARPASAIVQAMALGFGATALAKWGTGRGWPNAGRDPTLADRLEHPENARDFRPFRAGFGAFPSGHTLTMTSAAAALSRAAPSLGLAAFAGYPLAAGVAAGMWLGDRHWASDILSGALLGEAIGASVGKAFAEGADADGALPSGSFVLVPLARGGAFLSWQKPL